MICSLLNNARLPVFAFIVVPSLLPSLQEYVDGVSGYSVRTNTTERVSITASDSVIIIWNSS